MFVIEIPLKPILQPIFYPGGSADMLLDILSCDLKICVYALYEYQICLLQNKISISGVHILLIILKYSIYRRNTIVPLNITHYMNFDIKITQKYFRP